MNRTLLQKIWLLPALFCCLPLLVFGQASELLELRLLKNETSVYGFENTHPLYGPGLSVPPSHGTAVFTGSGINRNLEYTPAVDYIGPDQLTFIRQNYPSSTYTIITVKYLVLPSYVDAENDYTATVVGVPVTVDVLTNDYGNAGNLKVADIPAVNHGTAVYSADSTQITFTPDAGYEGLANFNYTICDIFGVCDVAIVNVCVIDPSLPNKTTRFFTNRDQAEVVLVPTGGYTLTVPPAHGQLDAGDVLEYVPDAGYVGNDQFIYQKTTGGVTYTQTVEVTVLDNDAPNSFVADDRIYTTEGDAVTFNVLDNDFGGQTLSTVYIETQPAYGVAEWLAPYSKGQFTYTPDPNFAGVDRFTYRAAAGGVVEFGTVEIAVNNQRPQESTLDVVTPKDRPVVVLYNIPLQTYMFSLFAPATTGTASIQNSYTAAGQTVAVPNAIVYEPAAGFAGQDEFEVEYCTQGDCKVVKIVVDVQDIAADPANFCIGPNCIWAGDTNNDGKVDLTDLLPLGLAMGEVGTVRPAVDLSNWYGQYGTDWIDYQNDEPFELKYVDADGNGVVNASDTSTILTFYGKQHGLTPALTISNTNNPNIYTGNLPANVQPGDLVEVPVYLGLAADPALDVHGFTFKVGYPTTFVDNFRADFSDESWMSYNSPVINLQKTPYNGLLDIGYTRTSGVAASGFGEIGKLSFIIIDDIEGIRLPSNQLDLTFQIGQVQTMNSAGHIGQGEDAEFTLHLDLSAPPVPFSEDQLKSFPNPATDAITFHLNGSDNLIEQVQVFDLTGRLVYDSGRGAWKNQQVRTAAYGAGMYVARVTTNQGVVNRKFEVLHP